ncbi:hypothetical protein [Mesorhizobium sp.]|uniref:hypothetical protein n=1 Tax=Mesorhizobium sp. TaxID=1871066 RepID=UPI000FE4946C|nr:hypothetical protein [Mesorhizobium sp.]RWF26493.1 MAG: hypothetical protein EOS45_28810 [Mesorhizobium sp.]TIX09122.1 MAG: hypothetical protein E5V41_32105 [Mesorhizobium sp.]TJW06103.1 MAG: hypothetical protein E5W97_09870 [Mesorhizobium sp.]
MSSLSALNNAALLVLQQQRPQSAVAEDSLVAGIDGVSSSDGSGSGSPLMQAQARISGSMFSVNSLNITAMKVRLMERVGKEFGIDQGDYQSLFSYGTAVKKAVEALKQKSAAEIIAIEKKLGLDQLGVSLDTLVNAIIDPQGSDGDRLDAALSKQAGDHAKGEGKAAGPIQPDEIGLYGR